MKHARQALLVAGWEFRRYFKWRDQILGLLLFLALGTVGYAVGRYVSSEERTLTIGVDGIDEAGLSALRSSRRLTFAPAPDESRRAEALRNGTMSGILSRVDDGGFTLTVEKDPRYRAELEGLLTELVRRERLARHGLDPQDLQQILQPAGLLVTFTNPVRGGIGRGEQIVAGVSTAIVILAIFMGMAYLLTGITGEKQLRVTESIVSAVRPQAWIDGKILGIGAYSLVNVANMAVGTMIVALIAGSGWGFTLPEVAVRPGILLLLVLFSALALLLWNASFAAFAATIDDPNTSARTSVMFLPMLFVGLGSWIVLRDPDSTVARVLAVFPLTSAPALPVRAILSDPGAAEIAISLALLIATIWMIRRAAGRIFEIGMLMYGKEPSFREIVRWARARPGG